MTTYSQEGRLLYIDTPLGKDVLLLSDIHGGESISQLFHYELQLSSTKDDIKAVDIVGKSVTIGLRLLDDTFRYFNGFVSRFASAGGDEHLSHYRAEIVPWMWFLTKSANCRIFQNLSVPDIVKQVFSALGFNDFDDSGISGTHETWDYCVQYRETDFNFISRLLEHEGIFYFFKHEDGKHTLVLADQTGAYVDCAEKSVEYTQESFSQITSWEHDYSYGTGKWSANDYNFQTPTANMLAKAETVLQLQGITKYETYDFPGAYLTKDEGDADMRLRIEAEEAGYEVVHCSTRCRTFGPGGKFSVQTHPLAQEQGKSFVIVSIQHHAHLAGGFTTGGGGGQIDYSNTAMCIPDSVVFRPPRTTPKPLAQGVQTALVVGPSGDEINVDKYGRVKVQFYWDRLGKKDEKSSCWVRVAQPWAGNQWGVFFWPRIGDEVVVQFLEGDPDRPLIVGSVYNAQQMPPYSLPDNKTRSGIKTNSSTGGGGSNEIRFEDKAGSEEVYVHAQKDYNRVVENNDTLKVGSSKADDGSQTIEIWKDRTETVKTGNETVTIEQGNRIVTVNTGDDTHEIKQGNRSVTVDAGNDTHDIKQGNRDVKIEMGNDSLEISMGNQTTKLDLGASSTEAMQSIELKVGQSSIKIDQMGVTIQGMMISIQGQVQTQVQGLMVQVSADAMLQAAGAITMIG